MNVLLTVAQEREKDGVRLLLLLADTQVYSIGIGHEKVVSSHPYAK